MLGIQLSVPESLPSNLQDTFSGVSKNYIFCFHSINPSYLLPNISFSKGQRMLFNQNYSNTINLKNIPSKYTTSGCNVIFQSLDVPTPRPFLITFWKFLFTTTSVLLFISSRTKFAHSSISLIEMNLPLLKFVIYPGHIGDHLMIQVLCSDYCTSYSQILQRNIIRTILTDPFETHKLHFWNANKKVVKAAVFARAWFYFEQGAYGNDRYACSRLVLKSIKMHILFIWSHGNYFITLAEVPNLSIVIYSKYKSSEASKIEKWLDGQYILTETRYTNYKYLHYFKRSGFQFSTYTTKTPVYCLNTNKHKHKAIDYSIWLIPFRLEIYTIIFIILIVLPMPFISIGNPLCNMLFDGLNLFGLFFRVAY